MGKVWILSMKEKIKRIAGIVILLTAFLLFTWWLNQVEKPEAISTEGRTFEKGTVTEILRDNIQENGTRVGEQKVLLKLTTGEWKGKEVEATSSDGTLFGATCRVGTKVIAIVSLAGENALVSVYTRDRGFAVIAFVIVFLALLCIIGGKNGVKAAAGLIFTVFTILYVFLPMLLRGFSPILSAVFAAAVTTMVTMLLVGGWNKKALAAIAGTVFGVIVAGLAAILFGLAADIDGYNVSDIEALIYVGQISDIRIGDLLFSGILIAALGAVMDVGMSISSTIFEIHSKAPELGAKELLKSGINVGRDMMGTMSNTLILAFAGGSLSVLVLNYTYNLPLLQVMNSYSIGIEIMQGISGSIGVILTVPLTALISVMLIGRRTQREERTNTL